MNKYNQNYLPQHYRYCKKCKDLTKYVYKMNRQHSYCSQCGQPAGKYLLSRTEYLNLVRKLKGLPTEDNLQNSEIQSLTDKLNNQRRVLQELTDKHTETKQLFEKLRSSYFKLIEKLWRKK